MKNLPKKKIEIEKRYVPLDGHSNEDKTNKLRSCYYTGKMNRYWKHNATDMILYFYELLVPYTSLQKKQIKCLLIFIITASEFRTRNKPKTNRIL